MIIFQNLTILPTSIFSSLPAAKSQWKTQWYLKFCKTIKSDKKTARLLIGPFKCFHLRKIKEAKNVVFLPKWIKNFAKYLWLYIGKTRGGEFTFHSSRWHCHEALGCWCPGLQQSMQPIRTASVRMAAWGKTVHSIVGLVSSTQLIFLLPERDGLRWRVQYKSMKRVQSSQLLLSFKECKCMHLNNETGGRRGYSTWCTKLSLSSAPWPSPSFLSSQKHLHSFRERHFTSLPSTGLQITKIFFFAKDWVFRNISLSCCSQQLHAMLKAAD